MSELSICYIYVVYFDGGLGYPSIYICQKSLNGTLKIVHALYENLTSKMTPCK